MITDKRKIWKRFENIFQTVDQLYKYQPAFCFYHKRLLEELCEDNIIYAEIRASLSPVSRYISKCYVGFILYIIII